MNEHVVEPPDSLATNPGLILVKIAAVYLLAGLFLGAFMGMSGNFAFTSLHAHISLLGWATLGITGVVYMVMPSCASSRLARLHFWGHNLGLPVMTISLALVSTGNKGAEIALAASSHLVVLSLVAFAANLFRNGRSGPFQGKFSAKTGS